MLRAITVAAALAACGGGSSTGDGGGGGDAEPLDVCPATQPTPIAVSSGFKTDGQHLYYYEANALYRRPVGGGAAEKLVDVANLDGPPALGTQDLFYIDGTQVMRIPKSGGTPTPLGSVPDPAQLATDGTAGYVWTLVDSDIQVWRADGTATLVTTVSAVDGFSFLKADGVHVYWFTAKGQLRRVPIAGGTVEDVADSASTHIANIRVTGFELAGDDLVWSAGYQSFPDGQVFAIAKQSGTRRELSHTGYPEDVSVLDGTVYAPINGTGGNRIVAIPLAGGSRTVVGCLPGRIDDAIATSAGVFATSEGQVLLFPL